jgi:hypothetical protein
LPNSHQNNWSMKFGVLYSAYCVDLGADRRVCYPGNTADTQPQLQDFVLFSAYHRIVSGKCQAGDKMIPYVVGGRM